MPAEAKLGWSAAFNIVVPLLLLVWVNYGLVTGKLWWGWATATDVLFGVVLLYILVGVLRRRRLQRGS